MNNSWFIRNKINVNVSRRIFCFPYAGGNAATYSSWANYLPKDVEVIAIQLPGRSTRLSEAPFDNMAELVDDLLPNMVPLLDKPYVIFGHSLGSRIGYELLSKLQLQNQMMPDCFIASGSRAAHIPDSSDNCWQKNDAEFIQVLKRLNGTPIEIFQHKELLELLLPMLRADFKISSTYQAKPVKLACSIEVLYGTKDVDITFEQLNAWKQLSDKPIKISSVHGEHFFIDNNKTDVLKIINKIFNQLAQNNLCQTI